MRVYLPGTVPLLELLKRDGAVSVPEGYAVTGALRAWYAEGDEEELEYAAMTLAARASLRRLAALADLSDAHALRVVLAVDVPDPRVGAAEAEQEDPGAVTVAGDVRLADVASLHLDEDGARGAVRAALAGAAADAAEGDPEALRTLEAVEEFDLLWYAAQELGDLV
jgi:hypothetical protein